jgi:hypothetical protein
MKMRNIKIVLVLISIAIFSSGCIGVNREFKEIKSLILSNIDDVFERQLEFSIGPVGFFIASQFVKFSDTEENVNQILSKVKNIHIGIYDRLSNYSKPSLSLLKTITNSIINEDWKPIVKSVNGKEMVGVFVKNRNPEDIEELFVITLSNDELVMVKLEGSLGSVIELIIREQGNNLKIAERR